MPLIGGSRQDSARTEVTNAAKTLLANIRFMDVDNPVKTIVITSSIPNEGKSFVAQNLSEAIATSGRTVLLIEEDLRRRTLANQIGVHARNGIYGVLSGAVSLGEAVVPTQIKNMYFLDAEPNIPNPSDLFNSRRYKSLLEHLRKSYDYVVIDTPPVTAFVDSAVLSSLVDATFLVVRENFTRRDSIRAAYEQLNKAGGNVSGVIMNYCRHQRNEYYYSYYYEKTGKDGGSAAPVQVNPEASSLTNPKAQPAMAQQQAQAVPQGQVQAQAPTPIFGRRQKR
ncbi:MAG: CpsD/CapB family tyrosine-protein kinase [Atopobiaceae bacterium]|nr:CpsD/CapB family tyrosine-protein kinase [Atopobiaceae bacterium]